MYVLCVHLVFGIQRSYKVDIFISIGQNWKGKLEQCYEYYSTLNESPVLEAWYANLIYVRSSSILTGEGANLIISQLSQPTVTSSISRNLKKMNFKKRWWQLIWSRRWKGENWSYLKLRIMICRGRFRPNYQGKLHSSFPTKSSSFYHCLQLRWIIQTTSDVEYL